MFKIECRNCGYFEDKRDNFKMDDDIKFEIVGEHLIKITCTHCGDSIMNVDEYYV